MRFPPVPPRARFLRLALAAFCAALLGACVFGGTGTDTENGVAENGVSVSIDKQSVSIRGISARVIDGEGRPVRDVRLSLYPPGYRPDTGAAPSTVSGNKTPITDANGYALIDLAAAGKFVVEGVSAGQTLFYDTLAVPDTMSAALFTFFAGTPKAFQGRVNLASGLRLDSGFVFIRGTGRWDKVDAAGNYDLGSLPAEAARMGIGVRYAASPTAVRVVTRTDTTAQTVSTLPIKYSTPVYDCTDLQGEAAKTALNQTGPPPGSSGPDSLGGAADTVSAKVNAAVQSCDSLPSGSVVDVKPVERANGTSVPGPDSVRVPVLVVDQQQSSSSFTGNQKPVVVPLNGCVASLGTEVIDFGVEIRATAAGSDILVGDIADKCLNP